MATSRRAARVAELIKREVSQLLFSGIKDDRVGTGMVSVTDVDVSGDLQHAKIFVSIYGTEEAQVQTMAGLKSATGFVRSVLGQRIRLRRTPEVVFVHDRGIERGTRVLSLINRLSEERHAKEEAGLLDFSDSEYDERYEGSYDGDFEDEDDDEFDDDADETLEDSKD